MRRPQINHFLIVSPAWLKKNNLKRSEQTDRTENIPRNNCFDFFESDGHIFMEPLSLVYLYYHFISGSISENLTGIVGHLVGS